MPYFVTQQEETFHVNIKFMTRGTITRQMVAVFTMALQKDCNGIAITLLENFLGGATDYI